MRLRLYHHPDGARVAYRETGTGRALVLLHSMGLTHREWEPVVDALAGRFRVVLPDLPLHGDSEDNPRHPYTPAWLTEVLSGFCAEVAGPHPQLVGHDLGAELILRLLVSGDVAPRRAVILPNRMHAEGAHPSRSLPWRASCRLAAVPGLDRVLSHAASLVFRPALGERLSAQRNAAARDLVRHAFGDLAGNGNRARAWARFVRAWPFKPQRDLLDAYPTLALPVLLLWAEQDPMYPVEVAREALERLPDAQLRTLPDAGFLVAYDDPIGLARELIAFCG